MAASENEKMVNLALDILDRHASIRGLITLNNLFLLSPMDLIIVQIIETAQQKSVRLLDGFEGV